MLSMRAAGILAVERVGEGPNWAAGMWSGRQDAWVMSDERWREGRGKRSEMRLRLPSWPCGCGGRRAQCSSPAVSVFATAATLTVTYSTVAGTLANRSTSLAYLAHLTHLTLTSVSLVPLTGRPP